MHENIQATRVLASSVEELCALSKNNLRGITMEIRLYGGLLGFPLLPFILSRLNQLELEAKIHVIQVTIRFDLVPDWPKTAPSSV